MTDAAIWIAAVSSGGVVLASLVQGLSTRSSARRESAARKDERDLEAARRSAEYENAAKVRAEERVGELEQIRVRAEIGAAARQAANEEKTRERTSNTAREFLMAAYAVHQLLDATLAGDEQMDLSPELVADLGPALGKVRADLPAEPAQSASLAAERLTLITKGHIGAQRLLREAASMLEDFAAKTGQ